MVGGLFKLVGGIPSWPESAGVTSFSHLLYQQIDFFVDLVDLFVDLIDLLVGFMDFEAHFIDFDEFAFVQPEARVVVYFCGPRPQGIAAQPRMICQGAQA
jgi:hypothetical protein